MSQTIAATPIQQSCALPRYQYGSEWKRLSDGFLRKTPCYREQASHNPSILRLMAYFGRTSFLWPNAFAPCSISPLEALFYQNIRLLGYCPVLSASLESKFLVDILRKVPYLQQRHKLPPASYNIHTISMSVNRGRIWATGDSDTLA